MEFYDLIDTYATLNGLDRNEVLHLWYRGSVSVEDLLQAFLNDEGIFGYKDLLVTVIKVLGARAKKDGMDIPWEV